MKRSQAIVTLAVGAKYKDRWDSLCAPNWKAYADRHGYDIHCFASSLDESERANGRSPAWQKCLILSREEVRHYERVVWLDSDILINSSAPCVTAAVAPDEIGAVEAWSAPTPELAAAALNRMYEFWGDACEVKDFTARDYYTTYGLPPIFDEVVQTGVLVLSPRHHRQLLEKVYFEYEETGKGNYEMRPLSWELLNSGRVRWIDRRFNTVWLAHKAAYYPFLLHGPERGGALGRLKRRLPSLANQGMARSQSLNELCVTAAFLNTYFLHFAGAWDEMSLVDLRARSWRDLS